MDCGRVGLRAAFRLPRGVEEAVMFAAAGDSAVFRKEGRRGGWFGG